MRKFLVHQWLHTLILLALLGGAAMVRLQDYQWSQSLRFLAFDTYNNWHPREPGDDVVIVDIDDVSMSRDYPGQWPWPRNVVADLVRNLDAMGARAIVFDMVFAEYDRTSPGAFLRGLPENQRTADLTAQLSGFKDHDEILAEAFRQAGNVVTGFVWSPNENATRRTPVLSKPVMLGREATVLRHSVPRMTGVTTSIPELSRAAAGNGCFGVSTEIDGLIRQVPLLFGWDQGQGQGQGQAPELYPSLALEALRVAQDPRLMIKIRHLKPAEMGLLGSPYLMQIGQYEIPFDRDGKFFAYFSKARTKTYIPAWQVLDNALDAGRVRDRIVLVGTSAEGLKDIRSTPLDLFIPGVEVHLNVIEQVMSGQYLQRPALLSGVELVFMLGIGLMIILLTPFIGAVALAGMTTLLVGGIGYASWWMFLHHGLLLDPVYPSLTVLALFIMAAWLAYIRTETEKKQVRDAFSHYISPDFMKELTADPDKLKLGGEVRELTVMFTDIRGFTSISEKLPPEELIQLMNDFLTPMSMLVMENRGTIDKYMGDAMMAFWNAPLDDADHARHACEAALKMNQALSPINERLAKGDEPLRLEAGIGINTGAASVGNMGSRQRFAYSALGDTVNLASRFEGQTKTYGVSILIGEDTARAVPDFALLELDLIRVKGKAIPVRIYTMLGGAGSADQAFLAWRDTHDRMLASYRRRDFEEAERILRDCAAMADSSMQAYYDVFAARIAALKQHRPNDDWDGVYDALSK